MKKSKDLQREQLAQLDRQALVRLRPGVPAQELQDLFGALWVRWRARDKGWFFDFSDAGFSARIDVNGQVARVSYFRMPAEYVIDGLHSGMSSAEALRLDSELRPEPPSNEYGFVDYLRDDPNGYRVTVRFDKDDQLISISYEQPGAQFLTGNEYLPAPAGFYPDAQSTPGSPFADSNLKLAVLGELLSNGTLDLGEPEDLAEHVLHRRVDLEQEGYDVIQPAYDYLARYPLTQAQLDTITELVFDAGDRIYPYVWYFWDGESDEFDIHSFQGIEACRNLGAIDAISIVARDAGSELLAIQARLGG